jgi:Uma2 family endonuclease
MQATAVSKAAPVSEAVKVVKPAPQPKHRAASRPVKPPRRIGWAEFDKRYLSREDGYKYEWVHGLVEKTAYTMNPTQLYIQYKLQDLFMDLKTAGKVDGQLLAETDLFFFPEVHRRPDFAWLTHEQAKRLAQPDTIEIPAFIIEVISTRDAVVRLVDKMRHYRAAGVQVVWLIYPAQQEVHVYGGPDLEQMVVRTGDKVCSATPVLPAFAFPASDIFSLGSE